MKKHLEQNVVMETERLILSELRPETDAVFICNLLNQPSFLENIGDRGVRNTADAQDYISSGPAASYQQHGFGLFLVQLKTSRESIGINGLIKRDFLDTPDLGFAYLPEFWGRGYATEAGSAAVNFATSRLGLTQLLAITNPDNHGSIGVLEKLGFEYAKMICLNDDDQDIKLFELGL